MGLRVDFKWVPAKFQGVSKGSRKDSSHFQGRFRGFRKDIRGFKDFQGVSRVCKNLGEFLGNFRGVYDGSEGFHSLSKGFVYISENFRTFKGT